jgi:hypothetical protein
VLIVHSAAAETGKGKGKMTAEEQEAVQEGVDPEVNDDDEDDLDKLIVTGKRQRKKVDYASVSTSHTNLHRLIDKQAEAKENAGIDEEEEDEDSDEPGQQRSVHFCRHSH